MHRWGGGCWRRLANRRAHCAGRRRGDRGELEIAANATLSWKRCKTRTNGDKTMTNGPVRVASIGMGWWSDVLADAIKRSGKIEIASCFTLSEDKRQAFAQKYGCRASSSYEAILADPTIEAIINTTPNNVHLETTRAAAEARKHIFLDKPIANSVSEGFAISECARKAGVVLGLGYQRRRESHFRYVRQQIDAGVF